MTCSLRDATAFWHSAQCPERRRAVSGMTMRGRRQAAIDRSGRDIEFDVCDAVGVWQGAFVAASSVDASRRGHDMETNFKGLNRIRGRKIRLPEEPNRRF